MNALEMRYALQLAGNIEAHVGELYESFADVAPIPRDAQFWRLLSFEEKTHSQMMRLIQEHIPDDFHIDDAELPRALRNNLEGLQKFNEFILSLRQSAKELAMDPFWQARLASDLERSELDTVLEWLMQLKVSDDVRAIVQEMTRGTTDHAERVQKFGQELASRVPEIACL